MKNRMGSAGILSLLIALTSGAAFSSTSAYRKTGVSDAGAIKGVVRLVGEPKTQTGLKVSKDDKVCGRVKPALRLAVGKNNGVGNAIVYLEGIREGKEFRAGGRYVLDQKGCEYVPHVMILPQGESLEIVNSDPVLHNVHAFEGEEAKRTVFNIAQPIRGQRTPIAPSRLAKPGLYLATCDAGHPWMSAYILVADHPYYTVTGPDGSFVLDQVPPGTYRLKVWHEGVQVVNTVMEKGAPKAYQYEKSYEMGKEVTVQPRATAMVSFDLQLR